MGLLDGIRLERSSDPQFRKRAATIDDVPQAERGRLEGR